MGKKAHPVSLRTDFLGWKKSVWYDSKKYGDYVVEDIKIRQYFEKNLDTLLFSRIYVERVLNKTIVKIMTHRAGVVIGKQGVEINKMKEGLSKIINGKFELLVGEVHRPEFDPKLIAENIAKQIVARMHYKRVIKGAVNTAMRSGVTGIKIIASGRLGGASICRKEIFRDGKVPLHTFRNRIFMYSAAAETVYGTCGIKVYVCLGEAR